MPDIFGRERGDYRHIRAIDDQMGETAWERNQDRLIQSRVRQPGQDQVSRHNFEILGRAPQDASAVGFLTNNLLAIQSVADEILYTAYRLPQYVSINSSIPEGAQTYGVRVRNRVGQAERVTAPGYDAPSATVSESLITNRMHYYGLDAIWSVDELREAMFAGVPLDTESVDAAVRGTMETMEAIALTGGGIAGVRGLLNLPYNSGPADDRVTRNPATQTFESMSSIEIRNLINSELSSVIENSRETMGRNISSGMTVYLPGTQYDLLTTLYIGDNADKTLMRAIMEDNPWTHFAKSPLAIERVLELSSDVTTSLTSDRMVVGLKNPRVAEMGVSINPRVLRILDKGRVVCAQVEAKFSNLFVKRASTIRYTDGI